MKDNKKKKKKIVHLLLSFLLPLVIGAAIGFAISLFNNESANGADGDLLSFLITMALMIVFVYVGIILHSIIHETGHLIGGLKSGYKFVSFRILNTIFIKENGITKAKKFNIPGTGGQCLMMPPGEEMEKYPYILYNASGSIMNIIASSVFFALFVFTRNVFMYSSAIFIPLIAIGMVLGILNILPIKLGGLAVDGYNIKLMNKNPEARKAFKIMLLANAGLTLGNRFKDMPAHWFDAVADWDDPISVSIALNKFNYYMDTHNFEEAKKLAGEILAKADKILDMQKKEINCELLFMEIIGDKNPDEINRLYDSDLKKYIKACKTHLSKRRIMYAYEKLITKDTSQAAKALEMFEKTCLTYPLLGEIEGEKELIQIIDEKPV